MKKIRNIITDKQLDFLQKLKEFIDTNGYTPTVRELGEYVGFSSPATTYWYLKKLEQYELIEIKNHRHIIIKEMSVVKE